MQVAFIMLVKSEEGGKLGAKQRIKWYEMDGKNCNQHSITYSLRKISAVEDNVVLTVVMQTFSNVQQHSEDVRFRGVIHI